MSESRPNKILYICGPMGSCKSSAALTHCDYNYPTFNDLEKTLEETERRNGYAVFLPNLSLNETGEAFQEFKKAIANSQQGGPPVAVILNPARLQITRSMFGPDEEEKYWRAAMMVTSSALLGACKEMGGKGDLVFMMTPPGHTMDSTPEAPKPKTWRDSRGAHIEVFMAVQMLGASFIQTSKEAAGGYRFAPVPLETMKRDLIETQGMKTLLAAYTAPAPQPLLAAAPAPPARDLSPLVVAGRTFFLGKPPVAEAVLIQQGAVK